MAMRVACLGLALCALFVCGTPAGAADKAAQLEQQYQKERNPRKRSEIARKLLLQRFEALRTRIGTGVMLEESSPELNQYQRGVELLANAVREAAHHKTSKDAEKSLRDQEKELSNLKMLVSAAEHRYLDRLLQAVGALKEELLYGLYKLSPATETPADEVSRR
ncbi:MAG TPA: hypothetical protein VNN17_05990 [Terriglobia bacterium]|nr:hypothetical protein [Terriglobia bacterium]